VPGEIVECGTFKGASTAKLSLVAKMTGRKLFACDSFKGLPASITGSYKHSSGRVRCFTEGEYAATLDEVRHNIRSFGSIDSCTFVPGLFADSLPTLDVAPAVVFIDVDYVSSALDCLRCLWPRLRPGGLFFTHEASFFEYVEGITNPEWWHEHISQCPPALLGAGYGVNSLASQLAYFRKGGLASSGRAASLPQSALSA
jgi:O-methyltransferase